MSDSSKQVHPHHRRWGIIIFLVVLGLSAWGIVSRIEADSSLQKRTENQAVPTVTVMQVAKGPVDEDLVLPGNVQAWHEAPIYARTNGYIKDWKTDIGAHVKEGDLLAEIETPEIDAQTHQAEADLGTAEANNQLAQTTAKRWLDLLKTNSVSKQETDEKLGAAAAGEALVASAKANLDRLRQTEDFKRVVAPFDGVISARNIDTGSLINAGSSGAGPELFHIVETDKLRVYVQVPEYDAAYIKPDLNAEAHFAEYPQKTFSASLEHTADAIDPASRTLLIQLVIDNSTGELMPGSYAEVHIKLPQSGDAVHLPVNTLLFRGEGMQAAVVDSDGKAQLKKLTIGRDYGKEVEVTSGVAPGDTVILNPPDSLESGQPVKVAPPSGKDDKNKGDKKP
jgi:RND family efflux transporter MFP subunit